MKNYGLPIILIVARRKITLLILRLGYELHLHVMLQCYDADVTGALSSSSGFPSLIHSIEIRNRHFFRRAWLNASARSCKQHQKTYQ
jgi:hypothetical protein